MTSLTRRSVLVGAAAGPVAMALGACGKDSGSTDTSTISMMIPLLGSEAPSPTGELARAIEKFIGKKLSITWIPNSDYGDRTTVTLASDSIPKVMVVQGKIPAFAQNKKILLASSVNGRVYGIFRLRDPMRTVVILRKDWLDRLKLKVPQNVNDLYNVAKAFTQADPNGNGKGDTYGLIIPKWPGAYATASPYDVIETWFGAPNGWGVRGGKLYPGFDTPAFLSADRFMKKMIDERLINPDFATLDSGSWNDPFFNGKGGIIIDVSSRALDLLSLFKEKDPKNYGNYVAISGNLLGPDGQRHSYPTVGYNGFLAISKQSVQSEAELDDILAVLDKLSSKQGQNLLNNGIEGRNFTVQDGWMVPKNPNDPKMKVIANDVTAFAQLGTQSNGFLAYQARPAGAPERAMTDLRTQLAARDLKTAVYDPALPLVSQTYTQKGAQLDQIVADARIKYLAGQLDESGLKSEIKRWYAEGGQQVIDEMDKLYPKIH
jgi:putative aldouronate transport system substrate-binding protein